EGVTVAPAPALQVELQVAVTGGHVGCRGRRLPGERRPAQVGVEHHAGAVDDLLKPRHRPGGQPLGYLLQTLWTVERARSSLVRDLLAYRVGDQRVRVALQEPAVAGLVQKPPDTRQG